MTLTVERTKWVACVALLAAGLPATADRALAQGEVAISTRRAATVEEIVVTAQKREESLQDAPLSVTALTGEMLEQAGYSNVNDIRTFVPNLNMHTNAGGNTGTTVSIRGMATGDPIVNFEPAVGIYTNGLYVSKSVGSLFDSPDLERIEVLRGPQGTLYGRNTIGGAINIIPRRPGEDPEAILTLGGGNYDYFTTGATLDSGMYDIGDGELLGRLGARGTILYRLRDGFYKNREINGVGFGDLGSNKFDELDRITARISTRWQPREDFTLDYVFDWFESREVTTAFQLTAVRPGSTIDQFNGLLPADIYDFIEEDRVDQIGNNRVLTPRGALQPIDSDRDSEPLENPLNVKSHNITATLDLGEVGPLGEMTLKSISGWRRIDSKESQDLDGTPMHISDFQNEINQEQFSEEIQLVGNAWEERVDYVIGFYYFDESGGERNPQIIFGDIPAITTAFDSSNRFDNTAYAPYGQATVRLPFWEERISLTGGLRYSWEKKRAWRNNRCVRNLTACSSYNASASKSFDNWSPMGSISVDVTDEIMTYFRVARGFKSGGFNGRAPVDRASAGDFPQDLPVFEDNFDEETVTAYELGFKTRWFDDRLQLNTTGFYNDNQDRQISAFKADPDFGAVTFVANADVDIWGAEVEAMAVPIDGLEVRLAYALLRPSYRKLPLPDEDGTLRDRSDDGDFGFAPEHTVSVGIGYAFPPTPAGIISARVDGYWQDDEDYLLLKEDNRYISAGDYFLLNGRIQLAEIPAPYEQGTLDLGFWGRNILDRKYRTFGIDFGDRIGTAGNTYGEPRTFGADLTWRWGGTA
jgi:iron complex outermembrane receptor protein